jgi:hypothetical protein
VPSSSPPCGGWGTGWTEVLPACCVAVAGSSRAAASLPLGRHVLLHRYRWAFACCCVAVAASGRGLRKGLDRGGGLGSVGSAGRGQILHLCGIHARFFLRVDRALRRKHRGDEMAPWRAVILLLRGTVRAKGESLSTRRVPKPRWTQDSAFARGSPNDAALVTGSRSERSILRPLTHERRILRPRSHAPSARPTPDPSADRGPFGGRVDSPPQRRSSRKKPSPATQQRAKPQPSDAASGRDPATATQPQVEARTDGYATAKSLSASA